MKKSIIVIIGLVGISIVISLLFMVEPVFQSIPHHPRIVGDTAMTIMNNTASQYDVFTQQTMWQIHVSADGKIHPIDGNGKIKRNVEFSCSFPIIPNDGKDHFVYLSVFRNNNTGYIVVLDDQTGQIIESKPVSHEAAGCGP